MTIWFATGNIHKKNELEEILSSTLPKSYGWGDSCELKIPKEAGINFDVEETGNTFMDNAYIKASALYRTLVEMRKSPYSLGDPVIADDSGLCIDALDGRPGVNSARYSGPLGGGSMGKLLSAAEKNTLLLHEMGNNANRRARFICAMVLFLGPNRFFTAQETMEGEVVRDSQFIRGQGGFGYDPIFYIPRLGRTTAELSAEEKNNISHRGKAGKAIAHLFSSFEYKGL